MSSSLYSSPLPPLPQPRPASGSTPSSRNRSVHRLREAVSQVRQSYWSPSASSSSIKQQQGNNTESTAASAPVNQFFTPQRGSSSSANATNATTELTPLQKQQLSVPRPMIARMPLRARTPSPMMMGNSNNNNMLNTSTMITSPTNNQSPSRGGGGGGNQSVTSPNANSSSVNYSSSSIAQIPSSPYSFFTGDTPSQLAQTLLRGARVVRAHGLSLDQPESEQSVTMKLFGSFAQQKLNDNSNNNKKTNKRGNSRPPSGENDTPQRKNKQQQKLKRTDSMSSDASSTVAANMLLSLAQESGGGGAGSDRPLTEEEEARIARRTQQLLSGEIKALLEPRSVFFQPSLSDAPLAATQLADEFTAGNARKKLISVLNRTTGNESALAALKKASNIVSKVQKRKDEENDKNNKKKKNLDEGDANETEEGGGGDGSSDPAAARTQTRSRRNKDKDPATLAREHAELEEAEKVKAACKFLLDIDGESEQQQSKNDTDGSDGQQHQHYDFPNHKVLFGRIRRILLNLSVNPSTIASSKQYRELSRSKFGTTSGSDDDENNHGSLSKQNTLKSGTSQSAASFASKKTNNASGDFTTYEQEYTDHDISILPRHLIRVLCDALDITPSVIPQWEILARREYQIQEAARHVRDPRKLASKKNKNNNNNQDNLEVSFNTGGDQGNSVDNNGGIDTNNNDGSGVQNASFVSPMSPSNSSFASAASVESPSSTRQQQLQQQQQQFLQMNVLHLSWPSVETLGRQVIIGTTLRSLVEEFTSSMFEKGVVAISQTEQQKAKSELDEILAATAEGGGGGTSNQLKSSFASQASKASFASPTTTSQLSIPRVMQEAKIVGIENWQPVLQVAQVSKLAKALLTTHQGSTVDLVISSVFNFVYNLVEHRHHWTEFCNDCEDFLEKTIARNEKIEKIEALSQHQKSNNNSSSKRGHSPSSLTSPNARSSPGGFPNNSTSNKKKKNRHKSPDNNNNNKLTASSSPPSPIKKSSSMKKTSATVVTINDGNDVGAGNGDDGDATMKKEDSMTASEKNNNNKNHAENDVDQRNDVNNHNDGDSEYLDDDDDDDDNNNGNNSLYPPEVPFTNSMIRLALVSDRPQDIREDFYELEYIAFQDFSEFLKIFHDRRHITGLMDHNIEHAVDEESLAFALIHNACSSISAAFRHVLKKQQIEEALAGTKKKNKKMNFDDLPPKLPNKTTILRVKELREAFKESEKVAGPLLPFSLAAYLAKNENSNIHDDDDDQGVSRWRQFAPLICYL